MVWAHESATRSPWSLSQSGMPMAAADFLPEHGPADLQHPSQEALPAYEAKLAELFGVRPERVIATLGASGGMLVAALRWFGAGSRVLAEVPSYEPVRALPALLGADVRYLRRRLEHGWQPDPDEAARELARGAGPGHVFVTNLHNPSGALTPRERMQALAAAAGRAGGVLVSCEVYMEYVPAARRVHAFELAPNGVSIGSLTKAYGLGPLRLGWIVLGEALAAERARLQDLAYLAWVDPPTATLRAGVAALGRLPELLQPLAVVARESRPPWERWLASTPGVEAVVPEFGIIAFPRVAEAPDTVALGEHLAAEHRVDVVPGEFFGAPGHVRVGCGVPRATLEEGLARLARGIAAFRGR
jgi:aspartate/methionine/tyrosine aminotransferase